MSQQPIGVAVIGAGMAGRAHCAGYRSAPTLFDPPLPPIHYAAVIDADVGVAADAAQRYGYERSGTNWRELLTADDVQVVSVVVANALHREIVEIRDAMIDSRITFTITNAEHALLEQAERHLVGHDQSAPTPTEPPQDLGDADIDAPHREERAS